VNTLQGLWDRPDLVRRLDAGVAAPKRGGKRQPLQLASRDRQLIAGQGRAVRAPASQDYQRKRAFRPARSRTIPQISAGLPSKWWQVHWARWVCFWS